MATISSLDDLTIAAAAVVLLPVISVVKLLLVLELDSGGCCWSIMVVHRLKI